MRESQVVTLPVLVAPHPPGLRLDEPAPDFSGLRAIDGSICGLATFQASPILVLAFLGDSCPAVKAGLSALGELHARFRSSGVQVVGINSNNGHLSPRDTYEEMVRFADERQIGFPYLKDPDSTVARRYGATNTPHFLVLDADRRLRYRGRMFDSREPERATQRDLEDVVRALVDGRPVVSRETHALGCSIVW